MYKLILNGSGEVQGMQGVILSEHIHHHLIDFTVIVSEGQGACSAEEVQVFVAFYVDEKGSFGLFDCDGKFSGVATCVGFCVVLAIEIELVGGFVHYPSSFYTMVIFVLNVVSSPFSTKCFPPSLKRGVGMVKMRIEQGQRARTDTTNLFPILLVIVWHLSGNIEKV